MTGHALSTDWRFAELAARCHLDPVLATRYAVEPYGVLAEFGIHAEEGDPIPALPADLGSEVTITSLDRRELVPALVPISGCGGCRVEPGSR
ncbi:hypothetical protein GCM10009801_33490 [Streptomyces albiaxialis]|uniref:Uncharacterized protein n=1 Tax=Streptomyces albiaxialis TaxID=329523 RepID=A0ABP5HKR6_9ACTN